MENYDLNKGTGAPRVPGTGPQHPRLFERAYECLGSKNNDKVFMIAEGDINDAKNPVSFCTTSLFLCCLFSFFNLCF
jgi:hypothetical protein